MPAAKHRTTAIEERLAAWEVVFPHQFAGIPNVHAEWLVALEDALQELRETRRPIREADRHTWSRT